jgi:hypothetical protein
MSNDLQKQLAAAGSYAFKVVLTGMVAIVIFLFNDMRNSIKEISHDMKDLRGVAIELRGEVRNNTKDIERLDRTKADRK